MDTSNIVMLMAGVALVMPLLAFIVIGLGGRHLPRRGDWVAISATIISFVCSVFVFANTWKIQTHDISFNWISLGIIQIGAGIYIDNLSSSLLLLITLITSLVMIYSTTYMKEERYYARYFSHLSFFLFAMLGVVLADSLFLVFVFWELVGFASYLLIGFWFQKDSAAKANRKAFITNRIGDIAFLIGMILVLISFGTLDIQKLFGDAGIFQHLTLENNHLLTIIGLCLFCGAVAKSAQFPLNVWLPDAMEGPTVVSSLIHAATMVAAGVYLTARIFPIFTYDSLLVIAILGSFTAFMAATIAITQNDIKKVLAYSTISQLGFMLASMGVGAWSAGIFHLVTHAFFKCLLFLSAGSVIYSLHQMQHKHHINFDAQDMRLMGGLRSQMPITCITFLIASMSLAGLPLFSGHLSKDLILVEAWNWAGNGGLLIVPILLSITVALTAFYIFRLIFNVFYGENRLQKKFTKVYTPIQESPKAMLFPIIILSVFTVFVVFGSHPLHGSHSWFLQGLGSPTNNNVLLIPQNHILEKAVPAFTVISVLAAIWLAYRAYSLRKLSFLSENNFLYKFSQNAWYQDKIYDILFVKPIERIANTIKTFDTKVVDGLVNYSSTFTCRVSKLVESFDILVIDGAVNGLATFTSNIGNKLRRLQTGRIQQYMIFSIIGFILITLLGYIFI